MIKIYFVIILGIIVLYLFFKLNKDKNENLLNLTDKSSYNSIRDQIILEYIKTPILEENFKFDSLDKVTNNIEKYFNVYLDLINTDRINLKLNQYLQNKGDLSIISMQNIFTLKNLDLNSIYDSIYIYIDRIYSANSHYIDEDRIKLYALFKIMRTKFYGGGKLRINYHNDKFVLLPEPMYNFTITDETLNSPIVKTIKEITECGYWPGIPNSTDNEVCIIDILDYASMGLKKYNIETTNIMKNELANNLDKIILLCELLIVYNLILQYNDTNDSDNNFQTIIMNLRNTKFKNLETEIKDIYNSMKNYEIIENWYNDNLVIQNIVGRPWLLYN